MEEGKGGGRVCGERCWEGGDDYEMARQMKCL